MKIRGYKLIHTHDDISVYQQDYVDMNVIDLIDRELESQETYLHPRSVLDLKESRSSRYHRSHDQQYFTFKLNGEEVKLQGFIHCTTKSSAAKFICDFMVPQINSEHDVEKALFELGDRAQSPEGHKIIENRLEHLSWRQEIIQTDLDQFVIEHIHGDQWLIRKGAAPLLIDHYSVKIGDDEIPVFRYALVNHDIVTFFDGQRFFAMNRDDHAVKRALYRLNGGHLYTNGDFCPVPHPAVTPLCWLRVPSFNEYEALKAAGLSEPPPLPEGAPRIASAMDSLSTVIIQDPATLPIIRDPHEAIGVLSRTIARRWMKPLRMRIM